MSTTSPRPFARRFVSLDGPEAARALIDADETMAADGGEPRPWPPLTAAGAEAFTQALNDQDVVLCRDEPRPAGAIDFTLHIPPEADAIQMSFDRSKGEVATVGALLRGFEEQHGYRPQTFGAAIPPAQWMPDPDHIDRHVGLPAFQTAFLYAYPSSAQKVGAPIYTVDTRPEDER